MSNEKTEFDLELAKRGAMFWACDKYKATYRAMVCVALGAVVVKTANEIHLFSPTLDDFLREYAPIRMATNDECAKAGVEYIEAPVDVDALINDKLASATLTEAVSIGNGIFNAGVKVSTVIGAARRLYLYQQKETVIRLPISIAPSNVLILCYLPNGNCFVGEKRDVWRDSFGAELRGVRPTHWQHLP